ncbi:hypothetical protein GALMADRAFT_138744 [Galerina marginata CBS 339.88]|uniref:Uncharacterized protein n=1 Tax=Galerina marginata (strain CBS 339.88) TaxID=685588 RepID=A0A067TCP6_GALM3|nr:hypothetical protein GALMADRAFT_138744 [Galerina marginata CBS 339.88]
MYYSHKVKKLEETLDLMIRAQAAELRKSYKLAGDDEQVDHIFEVQYFSAVFLHTVAETILSGEEYSPEVEDIHFAVNLVNHGQNLKALKKEFHGPKTVYFRAGNTKPTFSQKLLEYLVDAAPKLNKAFNDTLQTVKQSEHHQSFKTRFIHNLLNTPWCSGGQWEAILKETEPFSKNLTLKNYVTDGIFKNDNVNFK